MWLTADTHFGHGNVIRYSKRPWQDVDQHDQALIANWNAVVGPKDTVWHLGDFCRWERDPREYLDQLNGVVHLCFGNHDREHEQVKQFESMFASVQHVKWARWNKRHLFLSHYPHRAWRNSHEGSFHCFGHTHGDFENYGRSMDVGVDAVGYAPIHADEVMKRLEDAPPTPHHRERGDL